MRERVGAKDPAPGRCAPMRRPRAPRSPPSSPSTTSPATAIEALGAVLAGTQSLHTNSYDETLCLPDARGGDDRPAHAADHRRGDRRRPASPTRSAAPTTWRPSPTRLRGGAWLHRARSTGAAAWSRRSRRATRKPRSPNAAYAYQRALDRGDRRVVGVNSHVQDDEPPIQMHRPDPTVEQSQIARRRRPPRRARRLASHRGARRAPRGL